MGPVCSGVEDVEGEKVILRGVGEADVLVVVVKVTDGEGGVAGSTAAGTLIPENSQ